MKNCNKIWLALLCLWLAGCAGLPDNSEDGAMPGVPTTELHSNGVATLTAPADLWDRIRRGFAMPDLGSAEVSRQQARYLKHPESIQRMTERSRRYMFHIVEQLELRDMPTELALLPYVESAFNPQAVSSAKAAGLWQFIPSTGTLFDLNQDAWRDDRRNVVASTRAALDYLQELHHQFDDWQLALAAYNWGPGSVERAIKRNVAQGLGTTYTDLRMPRETAQYVPRLQALKNIVATPEAFGVALPRINNHPFFDTVTITKDMDVDVAARLAGISVEDFKALNPAFKRPVILADGTAQILLPWDNANHFEQRLSQTDPDSLVSWTLWQAPTNASIKDVASRFNMSEQDLRRLNALPRRTRQITRGSAILVRRGGQPSTPATRDTRLAEAAPAAPAQSMLSRTVIKTKQDDSIRQMAARYDLPADTVARWNQASKNEKLKPGRDVVLYLPRESQTAAIQTGKIQVGSHRAVARVAATATRAAPATAAPAAATAVAPASTQGKVAVQSAVVDDEPLAPEPEVHASNTAGKMRIQTASN